VDQERQPRPLIDNHEKEDFDQSIAYAMEYNLPVKLLVWYDGFTAEMTGCIHFVDEITHHLSIQVDPGEFKQIAYQDVVGLVVVD
jgi:hypothetical protein